MDENRPELTPEGAQYALNESEDSMVASVALQGYGSTWPEAHIRAAIEACNEAASKS